MVDMLNNTSGLFHFYKDEPDNKTMWTEEGGEGEFMFSFDGKTVYNLFADYPWKLKPEEKAIFDKENPYWVEFFKDRQ